MEGWVLLATPPWPSFPLPEPLNFLSHVPACPMPNFLPSVPLSLSSVASMLPKVVNKFLDSTLHKVLPGLVSAQSQPLPCIRSVLRPGPACAFHLRGFL